MEQLIHQGNFQRLCFPFLLYIRRGQSRKGLFSFENAVRAVCKGRYIAAVGLFDFKCGAPVVARPVAWIFLLNLVEREKFILLEYAW